MRQDLHRPSQIVPDDYAFVGCEKVRNQGDPIEDSEIQKHYREVIRQHMASTGGTYSRHEHGGNCSICGSVNLIYSLLFYHAPSNSYIRCGDDCAEKLEMGGTREASAFRAAIRNHLEAQAGKKKAIAVLSESGLDRAWELYAQNPRVGFGYEETTIRDIVSKLVRYGSISVNQGEFVRRLLVKIDQREVIAAQRAAENEAAAPCPTGRVKVIGSVLSTKLQESIYGTTLKMLVKDDTGFKVWCTVPGNAAPERGDRVEFFVNLEPSNDDPKFGFGKRPTKFQVTSSAVKEEHWHAITAPPIEREESTVPDIQTRRDDYYPGS